MEGLLGNKTILVTGAGGLLGAKLVSALLRDAKKVIASDIDVEAMRFRLQAEGVDVSNANLELSEIDVTDEACIKNFFCDLEHLDGAVNAAYPRNKNYGSHFFDVSLESFNENVSLNLGSSFLFMQQCAEYFKCNEFPFSLVNISSIYGVVAPKFEIYNNTGMTTPVEYAAIKSGLIHLTKYVAKYVADSRFRVNLVSPGGIFDNQPIEFLNAYKKETFGKGMLDASDLSGAVCFLLSDYSSYMNGQNLVVDDGFTL